VGTVTNGGGDLEMFFRVLKQGHTLFYEPKAIVRHRHRRDYAKLRSQIANNSIGLFSYGLRSIIVYPEERLSFFWLLIWWFVYWVLRRLWISFKHPTSLPKDLVQAEFEGCFVGLKRYQPSRQNAAEIAKSFDSPIQDNFDCKPVKNHTKPERPRSVAVRGVDLSQPIQALKDIANYSDVRVFINWKEELLGSLDIANAYQTVSKNRLIGTIVNQLDLKIVEPNSRKGKDSLWSEAFSTIEERYGVAQQQKTGSQKLPNHIPVSINLATYDRPSDLRNCLHCLVAQKTSRHVEIIVVDNHPASGLTPPVVAEFPSVILISEPRQGLAYARNAGFAASTGDIVIATDDDVTMPSDWLEKLVAPFARPDVMIVTGNVLPLQLETIFQRFFERYGGLGRGFEFLEASSNWFESFPRDAVPTWRLGATANAAFRASMFAHPQIGLMEEALGPGMPSGVGEDTYLFYKVLKAGYSLIYEPAAYVWHKHRSELSALRRQIYGYSKGHVAYNITTWLQDADWRGLWRVLIVLPLVHLQRIIIWFRGKSDYPLSLIFLEIIGNLAGPWSLWQSHRRVRREGRSSPYIPPQERFVIAKETVLVEKLQPAKVGNSRE
jgi:GT2 family glycosyltransferase